MLRRRAAWLALALLLAGCARSAQDAPEEVAPAPATAPSDLAARMAALERCPAGDAPWRAARDAARSEEERNALLGAARRLAERCEERWEPLWLEGECLKRLHRAPESVAPFRSALARARHAHDPAGVAATADRLAGQLKREGDLDGAERLYEEALDAARVAGRTDLEGFSRNNLAGLLVDRGRLAEAIRELGRAEALLAPLGDGGIARHLAYNRASLERQLGNAAETERTLRRLHDDAREAGDAWTTSAAAVSLGLLLLSLDRLDEAERWLATAAEGPEEIALRAELARGRLEIRAGRPAAAARRLEEAARQAGTEEPALALIARSYQAEAERRAGHVEEARRRFDAILAEISGAALIRARWLPRWLAGRLALAEGENDRAAALLAAAVQDIERQSSALDPSEEGLRYLRERAEPYVDLARALVRARPGEEGARRALAVLARAEARALKEARPETPDDVAARTQQALAADERLLAFALGVEGGLVIAVGPERIAAAELPPRAGIEEQIRRLLDAAGAAAPDGGTPDGIAAASARLGERLVGPVRAELRAARRLFIVPDGLLSLLPPALLRDGDRFLVETRDLAVFPFAGPPPRGARAAVAPVLLAGAPALPEGSGFPELGWAAFELHALRELWGEARSALLTGADLVADRLTRGDLSRYRTLHLATHAVASTADPRLCSVILARGERLGIDRIAALRLPGAVVVLSACRTAVGELVPGQGLLGLRWAFERAGARAVVASHWAVDDRRTARLMTAFHRALEDGGDPAAALARAQRDAIARGVSPRVWGAFSVALTPAR